MSAEYRPSFLGTGSAHPKNSVSNEMAGEFVAEYYSQNLQEKDMPEERIAEVLGVRKHSIVEIAKRIGIENRYWCSGDESTSTMGIEAGHNALEASGVKASDIKGVILTTGMGDYIGTSTAGIIAKELGVPQKVMTHDISAACTGFAHAVFEAAAILTSPLSLDGPILVISSETISKGMHRSKKGTIPIFGDGAGAVVVGLVETGAQAQWPVFTFGVKADDIEKLYIKVGGSVNPITPETKDEDRGVFMDNKYIFTLAKEKMVEAGEEVQQLSEEFNGMLGISYVEPSKLIPHQANLMIMSEVQQELQFSDEGVIVNISKWANTGSASIPIALDQAVREGRLTQKDSFMGVVFGSGILWAGFIMHLYGLGRKWEKFPHGRALTVPTQM